LSADSLSGLPPLVVLQLSESFAEYWPLLSQELQVPLEVRHSLEEPFPHAALAVVFAAGGSEGELPAVLFRLTAQVPVPLIAVGASTSHRVAAQVVAAGAIDYFALPEDRDALRSALAAVLARWRSARDRAALAQLEAQEHTFREIVGESPALRSTLSRAARILPHRDATVLVTGETGTGKELLARALHYGGPRATGPFVELNCAAVPNTLLESELFGHERGAFTDARAAKPGLFEAAGGGSLFLDEIDSLALELQAKLLRALEQKVVRRLGATSSRTVDVRIIAATNTRLDRAVAEGRFREDLYYRLNVVTLELPPLRSRGADVVKLAEHFVGTFSAQYQVPRPPISQETRRALLAYPWPGNVRELRNVIERTVLLSPPGRFDLEPFVPPPVSPEEAVLPFPATLARVQRSAVEAMLELTGGNRSEAARRLGVSRSRLLRLLRGGSRHEDEEAPEADQP
jgi:DNA-binding NtrC family response regulator